MLLQFIKYVYRIRMAIEAIARLALGPLLLARLAARHGGLHLRLLALLHHLVGAHGSVGRPT